MRSIISLELLKNLQDRGLIFWMLILPILFTVLFISVFTTGTEGVAREQVILSIVPGYTVMFVFFITITMIANFIKDRELGMTARLASTPLPPYKYLLGKWIPYMYIVFIQIVVLFLFGKIVYDVPLEQPFFLLITSLLLTFTVTGIGLALSLLVKTNNMGIAITQVIALGGAVLSGLWMPIDMMPSFIQTFSKFLPQYWTHQAFQQGMEGSMELSELLLPNTVLLVYGILAFTIAILRYPTFLKMARG
ncbi:ABC transporter permease [Oceanobacillus kapialis]|uniref:ABC transporter permease n=1 Tax=Oceanobacillus kapialis TaxID=481353 RepID=UPI00384E115D